MYKLACRRTPDDVPAPDCVEVSLSCPWISHCAGGGVVTYRLPSTTTVGAVLADFCHLGGNRPSGMYISSSTAHGYARAVRVVSSDSLCQNSMTTHAQRLAARAVPRYAGM